MQTVKMEVSGMTCEGCVRGVRAALSKLPGVGAVEVSLEAGEARVEHDPGAAPVEVLREAVEAAGFDVGAVES
jgi:copper chaperone CopZ